MPRKDTYKPPPLTITGAANSFVECNSTPHKRRRQTNQALEALGRLVKVSSIDNVDNKLNKNDILSLTLARLLRQKHWPSNVPNKNVELASRIENSSIENDLNGFIIALSTSGRVVFVSDSVEQYLRRNVYSLYPYFTSIYNCVSNEDHDSIRQVLSKPTTDEQQIICTWNLPRGKRPSRNHTENKTMLMTGRFIKFNYEENQELCDPLFVARCEQIISSIPNVPTNSMGSTSTTTLRFVLTDQLQIHEISNNTESLLGYKPEELIDKPISRILAAEHIRALEATKQNCSQSYTVMSVLDLYTRDGDRLTFLCNTHMLVEGRRKATKFGFLAQLIDPIAQYDFTIYANKQNHERLNSATNQEAALASNLIFDTFTTKHVLPSDNEQQSNNIIENSSTCPVLELPQRRKRRRTDGQSVKTKSSDLNGNISQPPQSAQDLSESPINSLDSLPSSASPIQEVGCSNELFSYLDEIFEMDKCKVFNDLLSIDDINAVLGTNYEQEYSLITPTMSSLDFVF